MAPIVLLCTGAVACLTPLTVYLAWVGAVNRRDRPTAVPGSWDFVAALAGLSGFLLVGGGLLVAGLQSNARVVVRGNWKQAREALTSDRTIWAVTAGGYLLTTAAAAGIGVLTRSRALEVYNVDPDRAAALVDAALKDVGVTAHRIGDAWTAGGQDLLELQAFDGFRHVTVWFAADDARKRQEVERAFRRRLEQEAVPDNPVAGWFASATVCLMFATLSFVVLLGYVAYLRK